MWLHYSTTHLVYVTLLYMGKLKCTFNSLLVYSLSKYTLHVMKYWYCCGMHNAHSLYYIKLGRCSLDENHIIIWSGQVIRGKRERKWEFVQCETAHICEILAIGCVSHRDKVSNYERWSSTKSSTWHASIWTCSALVVSRYRAAWRHSGSAIGKQCMQFLCVEKHSTRTLEQMTTGC